MSTERADYLDTQTLGGGEGYFHTENAETHATDGKAKTASPETPLVAELAKRLKANGLPVPKRANKAQLVAALRGE